MKKKVLLLIIMLFPLWVNAKDITNKCKISLNNSEISKITDDNHATYVTRNKYTDIKFECEENIKNVYIKYHDHSVKGKILFSNSENIIGQNNYLHELIKLNDNINSSSLSITHRRIGVNSTMFDLYNPLNLIIDYKVRDVSEYLKDAFFNNVNVYVSASLTSELITPFEFLNFI